MCAVCSPSSLQTQSYPVSLIRAYPRVQSAAGLPFQSYLRTSHAFPGLCFCDMLRENKSFRIQSPHASPLIPSTCPPLVLSTCPLHLSSPHAPFKCPLPPAPSTCCLHLSPSHASSLCLSTCPNFFWGSCTDMAIHILGTGSEEVGLGALHLNLVVVCTVVTLTSH